MRARRLPLLPRRRRRTRAEICRQSWPMARASLVAISLLMPTSMPITSPPSRACGWGNSTQITMAFSDHVQPWTMPASGIESHLLSTRALSVGAKRQCGSVRGGNHREGLAHRLVLVHRLTRGLAGRRRPERFDPTPACRRRCRQAFWPRSCDRRPVGSRLRRIPRPESAHFDTQATGRSVQISRSRHEGERNANQIGKLGALMLGSG
jgi:hypothetical protein